MHTYTDMHAHTHTNQHACVYKPAYRAMAVWSAASMVPSSLYTGKRQSDPRAPVPRTSAWPATPAYEDSQDRVHARGVRSGWAHHDNDIVVGAAQVHVPVEREALQDELGRRAAVHAQKHRECVVRVLVKQGRMHLHHIDRCAQSSREYMPVPMPCLYACCVCALAVCVPFLSLSLYAYGAVGTAGHRAY
jgi:hypothetical protein